MKVIQLTQEHKSKLIEMSNTLFPERKEIVLTKHNTIRFDWKDKGSYYTHSKETIHWFEFSWKILNKILEVSQMSPLKVQKEIILYGLICFNDFETCHPVEHLYILFNKHLNSIKSC